MEGTLEAYLSSFFWLILVHYVADFLVQTHWQATNKSKNNVALFRHVGVYTLFLLPWGILFALVNGVLHFVTDYFSSRESSKQFAKGNYKLGFAAVGADQMIHMKTLLGTLYYLGNY